MIELQPVRRENSADINDLKLKIIMIGGPRVGKSCILNKMVYNKFYLGLGPTIGVECGSIRIAHENRFFRIQVWDVEGHGGTNPIPEEFYKNAIGKPFLTRGLSHCRSHPKGKSTGG
jgi:GTPase SAR1 family protein